MFHEQLIIHSIHTSVIYLFDNQTQGTLIWSKLLDFGIYNDMMGLKAGNNI